MIPFFIPQYHKEYLQEIDEVLRSGWITTGPKTKLFENQLTEYCRNKNTLCVNSATSGMELVLRWFGVGKGDEVILPAYTYCATANVIVHCGAKPVFVDVGNDFNISIEEIKKHINSNTKVVMAVDFAGYPCDYDKINWLVKEEAVRSQFRHATQEQKKLGRVMVLADAAHSLGATYKGDPAGSLADISVFSFHAVKNLTTAEGGAICLNLPSPFDNKEIYNALNIKSLHGQSKDAHNKNQKGEWQYDVVEAGYKCNMTDLQAVMGIVALRKYESQTLPKRKHQFDLYKTLLSSYEWVEIPQYQSTDASSSCHLFPILIKGITEEERNRIMGHIFADNVSVNVHFRPVPLLSYYKDLGYTMEGLENTYQLFSREITLPVYHDLTDEQIKEVVTAVVTAVEKEIR